MRLACLLVLGLFSLGSAWAQGANPDPNWPLCNDVSKPGSFAACGKVLANPKLTPAQKAQAFYSRGLGHQRAGRIKDSLPDLTEAVKLAPANPLYLNDRGFAYAATDNLDAAILDFRAASSLKKDYVEPIYNLGLAYYFKGDVAKSIAQYNIVIGMRPNAFAALGNRCLARLRAGQPPQSVLPDCDAALRLSPNHPMNLAIRASARWKAGNIVGARSDCDAAIDINPNFGWPYFLRGVIKNRIGDPAGSARDIARGRALDKTIDDRLKLIGITA